MIKSLTLVIPVYNEEKRIGNTFPIIKNKVLSVEKKLKIKTNVIFVNDGSTDETSNLLNKLIAKDKHFNLIGYGRNKGKGHALKKGFNKAKGDYIVFMDADLSTPLKYLEVFINKIENEKTILIGSRKTVGAHVKKHQPWLREKLGQGFTLLSNIFIVWGVTDFTCGFKMFPNKIGKKIFNKVTINRWGYDSEVLFLAKKYKCKIVEIPVDWNNSEESKVDLKKDVIRSLADIVQIRINNFKNKYNG